MSTMSAMKGRLTTQGHHGTPHAVWPQAPRVRSGANQLEMRRAKTAAARTAAGSSGCNGSPPARGTTGLFSSPALLPRSQRESAAVRHAHPPSSIPLSSSSMSSRSQSSPTSAFGAFFAGHSSGSPVSRATQILQTQRCCQSARRPRFVLLTRVLWEQP